MMEMQKIAKSSSLRRLPLLFIAVFLAGLALIVSLVPLARADTTIYVRPGGDDIQCNGSANLDYSPAVAPNCALMTVQKALSLAGPDDTVIYTAGSLSITISAAGDEIGAAQGGSLIISKSGSPNPVEANTEQLIYTIIVTNTGVATDVTVTDVLPPPGVMIYVPGSATTSQGPGCVLFAPNPPNISCSLGQLAQDTSATVTIPVTPTAAGVVENVAVASSDTDSDNIVETTLISGITRLSIDKGDSPDPVPVGTPLTYIITVTNNGPVAAITATITDLIPASTTFVPPPASSTGCSETGGVVTCELGLLGVGKSVTVNIVVIPNAEGVITNTARVISSGTDDQPNDNEDTETTLVIPGLVYMPLILKDFSGTTTPPPPPPQLLAYVSDVAADVDTNQVFVASPRHNWTYVISGTIDEVTHAVPVGVGPTGLTVLSSTALIDNKVFVAHQYGINFWRPGVMAFGVKEPTSHETSDGGYVGAAPIKIASNGTNNSRVYVSNYYDKLAVLDGASSPLENRLGWVVQKGFQGAYGIDASSTTKRVYLATRDTGELVVFDGDNDRLLGSGYIPTHVKPPQTCSLWSVAVNEATNHVFVPCPQLSKVFVLEESQFSVLSLESLGVLENRNGHLALVVSPAVAPWIPEIDVPGGTNLGEEGIAVDSNTGYVFITNASNDTLVVLQDGVSPSYVTTVSVEDFPQGVDVNPDTQKVYVGNAGDNSVTVLNAVSPFGVIKTIPLLD